jgi:hypothetical protein
MSGLNKWFCDSFLPSIFERCEPGKAKWLSQKQTMVCTQHMVRQPVRYDSDGYGTMHTHDNYVCEWAGRSVHLSYSKKNGCGCIEFGFNAEEIASMHAERDAERERIKLERIERAKKDPLRLAKRIAKISKQIQGWQEEYLLDVEYGDVDDAQAALKEIAKLEAELALYAKA